MPLIFDLSDFRYPIIAGSFQLFTAEELERLITDLVNGRCLWN
jgi:hypothetical protein